MFRSIGTVKKIRVFVKEFSSSSPALASDLMQTILLNAKVPVTLFTVALEKIAKATHFLAFTSTCKVLFVL